MSDESFKASNVSGVEKGGERFPSRGQVVATIEAIEGTRYEVVAEEFNAEGEYVFGRFLFRDGVGTKELTYIREGQCRRGTSSETCIDVVFYDADGDMMGGESIAKWDSEAEAWVKQ